jgi:hypothetical protein
MREAPRKTQLSRKGICKKKKRAAKVRSIQTCRQIELDLNGGATGFITGVLALERKR